MELVGYILRVFGRFPLSTGVGKEGGNNPYHSRWIITKDSNLHHKFYLKQFKPLGIGPFHIEDFSGYDVIIYLYISQFKSDFWNALCMVRQGSRSRPSPGSFWLVPVPARLKPSDDRDLTGTKIKFLK